MKLSSFTALIAMLFLCMFVACATGDKVVQQQTYLEKISPPLTNAWNAEVRSQIDRLKTATSAVQGPQLTGKVIAIVTPDGKVQSVRLIKSSGVKLVDELAIQACKKASLPPPPARIIRQGHAQVPWIFNLKK